VVVLNQKSEIYLPIKIGSIELPYMPMNFLAHLHLSGHNPQVKLGNFIGDFVRGRNLTERYAKEIVTGIELHRVIDEFTDKHPIVRQSKDRLRPKYRHYAPVIVDIYYDHFLAINWHLYHSNLLPDFAEDCYKMIWQNEDILPDQVKWMMPHMIKGNWLVNYGKIAGMQKVLEGMTRRSKFDSKMNEAIVELEIHHEAFNQEFLEFFPLLKLEADNFLANC
jgi:acyl carrier protein phosphodiesterase